MEKDLSLSLSHKCHAPWNYQLEGEIKDVLEERNIKEIQIERTGRPELSPPGLGTTKRSNHELEAMKWLILVRFVASLLPAPFAGDPFWT